MVPGVVVKEKEWEENDDRHFCFLFFVPVLERGPECGAKSCEKREHHSPAHCNLRIESTRTLLPT